MRLGIAPPNAEKEMRFSTSIPPLAGLYPIPQSASITSTGEPRELPAQTSRYDLSTLPVVASVSTTVTTTCSTPVMPPTAHPVDALLDRKSTRLNSSHSQIS